MPQTSDPSSNTLPRPELNPLLNPLLAENMTRWAEVYFNNPPERRERAVIELLLQLEQERALREAATVAPRPTFHNAPAIAPQVVAPQAVEPQIPAEPVELVRCERCGRDNPVTHKFCGMCGQTLHPGRPTETSREIPQYEESDPDELRTATEADQGLTHEFQPREERYEPPALSTLSLFQTGRQESDNDYDAAYESSNSRSYRAYIGVVLAIVLAALGYTAWRASQNSRPSEEPLAVPPVASGTSSPNASPSNSAQSTAPSSPAPVADKAPPAPAKTPSPKTPPQDDQATSNQKAKSTEADDTASKQPSGPGGAELAQAELYLNGANGRSRDSAEAAQWLWKSMAKHNSEATLLLADLYLKGDGVAKNCDQARVLLDSAASKGVSAATERLRNLQAFGCQ